MNGDCNFVTKRSEFLSMSAGSELEPGPGWSGRRAAENVVSAGRPDDAREAHATRGRSGGSPLAATVSPFV